MKKLIPILLAVFALVSCEKDPDMDKLDNEYLVFTSHDTSTKFNDFSTYYIPDSILIIGDKKDPEYWKDENAQIIINAFKTKMNAAGYTAANKDDADLGLQVSYVASTYYFHGYYNDGPWWGYYALLFELVSLLYLPDSQTYKTICSHFQVPLQECSYAQDMHLPRLYNQPHSRNYDSKDHSHQD